MRRYLPIARVRIRVHPADSAFEVVTRVCAAHLAGSQVTLSVPPGPDSTVISLLKAATSLWASKIEFVAETEAQLAVVIREQMTDRVRFAAPERVLLPVLQAANEAGGCLVSVPVSGEGRLEMLWYLREQSVSTDYHRYGNLGLRVNEPRAEVL